MMMKAYQLKQWQTCGELVDVPVPEAGPGQVLLKVGGNGICQSDLHAMYEWPGSPPHLDLQLPLTMGHEVGGWIEQCGSGVQGLEQGQPCLLTFAGCGHCRFCVQGWNNYSPNKCNQVGMGLDGGLAEYVVAPAAAVVPLNTLEPWQAAPLTDAGLSSYHAVKRVQPMLIPGTTVVVVGVGGLGHLAVAALKATCAAKVIAVDVSGQALALGKEMGADVCLHSDDSTVAAIIEATNGQRADAVLDFVGSGITIEMAAQIIRPLGHIVVAGRGHGSFELKDRALPYGAMISTMFGGSRGELSELIALTEAGVLTPRITRYKLSDVQQAFEKLQAGEIIGRAVIVPDGH
jgi:propanol-preferring alcohol dehydrogenase